MEVGQRGRSEATNGSPRMRDGFTVDMTKGSQCLHETLLDIGVLAEADGRFNVELAPVPQICLSNKAAGSRKVRCPYCKYRGPEQVSEIGMREPTHVFCSNVDTSGN